MRVRKGPGEKQEKGQPWLPSFYVLGLAVLLVFLLFPVLRAVYP